MRRRNRRGIEIFNLSFLDVVSCGFGAIILLLVIVKVSEPRTLAKLSVDLTATVRELHQRVPEIARETAELERGLSRQRERLVSVKGTLARLQGELAVAQGRYAASDGQYEAQTKIRAGLMSAKQKLSEEMRRLLGAGYRRPASDARIGGVPVDSEYIIFIIDTSGSMQTYAWPLVLRKVTEILSIYPTVKGIQVMNDMGEYLFSADQGRWIPDSPARRTAIVRRLAGWAPFSNSSPVEGIEAAVRRFYATDKRISLYVFGDDFARGSMQAVVDTVRRLNRGNSRTARVRIHAVGFPVLFEQLGMSSNVIRFAALMRKLAEDNDGSFVGLNSLRR